MLIKALKILIVPILFLALYPIEKGLVGKWEDRFGSEIVYLPRGESVRKVRFGWNDIMADLLWIKGFHYVQGQWQLMEAGQKKPKEGWHSQLPALYDVVTDLDPHFVPAYRGGAVLIRALCKNPRRAIELLEKGWNQNPEKYWEVPYELAVVNLVDLGDEKGALEWLAKASDKERYPDEGLTDSEKASKAIVSKLRSYLETKMDRFDVAINLWEPWLKSNSPVMRGIAEMEIKKIFAQKMRSTLIRESEAVKKKEDRWPSDLEFKKLAEVAKQRVAKENSQEPLRGILADVSRWDFTLWQIVRIKPPDGEGTEKTRKLLGRRVKALRALQMALERFRMEKGWWPKDLRELTKEKAINEIPTDPGGGEYYLEPRVRIVSPVEAEHKTGKEPSEE